jgi:predicted GIY-YIG superfamily endonuclease
VTKIGDDSSVYWVYILRCKDETLYTGTARDVEYRATVHNAGKGAKYTRSRLPVIIVYCEECSDRSAALKREAAIKRMTRTEKLALISLKAW